MPSWAPALQIGLGADTSWRASRAKDTCGDTATQSALVGARTAVPFACLFKTARLTYSATMITNPTKEPAATAPRATDGRARTAGAQQAPGFCAQKSSNSPPPACAPPVVDWPVAGA